jgi:hypothetical protein
MATGRTNLLDLPLPVEGELDGTWGDMVNYGLTEYLDIAIAGRTPLTSANFTAGALTLSLTEGDTVATNIVASSAQYATLYTSSLATNSTITAPSSNRAYRVINADSTYTLTVKASGQTGITFQPGQSGIVAYNGTDYALVGTIGPTVPVARGGTGATTLTANNVILGNGTSAVQFVAPGTTGNVLTSDGTTWTSTAGASFATPLTVVGNATAGAEIRLPEDTDNGSNYVAIKAPDNIASNATLTAPAVTDTLATIGTAQTFTAAQTFRAANAIRSEAASTQDAIVVAGRAGGTSSYAVTLTPATLSSSTTLTLPNVTDTLATIGTTQTFTAAQTFRAANAIRSEAASTQDAVVIAGRAGGTSSYAVTLTPAELAASRTLTLPEPGENVTLGYLNIPQNSQSAAYTLVLADAGKHIFHPSSDNNARTFTIPANSSVPYPIGTAITFINMAAANVTIAITTDTMYLSSAGTTGSRTLAQYGSATAIKITSTNWIISGSGLT